MIAAAFVAKHLLVLTAILLAAAGAGTLALGRDERLALRAALGLALWAHALFFIALAGVLRVPVIAALFAIAVVGGALRGRLVPRKVPIAFVLVSAAAFVLALNPPLAFDETLYHLPFVRALAESGQLRFWSDFRFPVFPQFEELLCTPPFLIAGDVATHFVALSEMMITAALLLTWRRGGLAAALFAGSPLVLYLATVTYVDAALTMFVAAGFYCVVRAADDDRARWVVLAGLFLGTSCCVKYLGGYFAVAGFVLLAFARRRVWLYAVAGLAAALPTTVWLFATTGDPLFPFLTHSAWRISFAPVPLATRVVRTLRLPWDITFAREHVNFQPPVSPFITIAFVCVVVTAIRTRDWQARAVAIMTAAYVAAIAFVPPDPRYLVPLFPLIAAVGAHVILSDAKDLVRGPRRRTRSFAVFAAQDDKVATVLAISPAILYFAYVLATRGLPPLTPAARERMLTQRIPEYAALMHANGTVYVCGAEQLKYYARGRLLGDVAGPYAFHAIVAPRTSQLAANLRRIGADFFLTSKRVCTPPLRDGGMDLVYEDAGAQLWRVQRSQLAP